MLTNCHEGGLSYLSPRYGFACDTVKLFEIVIASGEITQAYPPVTQGSDFFLPGKNEDLFQALKGGSNNFGIVTRIDFTTLAIGDIWGGPVTYNISEVPKAIEAFYNFNAADPYDEYASTTQTVAYIEGRGLVGVNDFEYSKPVANPPAFAGWDAIPKISSNARIDKYKNITDEHASFSPGGLR